jgi:putative glutamine transport system substrate-binding protein
MLKKLSGLLFLIIFVLCGCAPKSTGPDMYATILKRDKLIVGTSYDSKPFAFLDKDGQVKGIEPDIAREIAKRMLGSKNKVVFVNVTPQDRIKAAMSGDVDIVISTMTITRKRKKLVNFSDPYYVAGQVICAKKDIKIESANDLINKKVIVILGTTGEENIKRFAPNALIWGFVDNADAINEFKKTSADAITTDDCILQGLAMGNSGYIILPKRLTKEPYGIAFKKSGQTDTFKDQLNKIINDIINDGTLDTIKEKWGIY